MFKLGKSVSATAAVGRPLQERIACAGYAAMAYWYYRWDWGEAVALDGLLEAGRRAGVPAFGDFVVAEASRWVTAHEAGSPPNPMGPSVALLELLRTGVIDEGLADQAWAMLGSLATEAIATGRRVGAIAPEADRQMLFVDSLYGLPEFLVRFGDARNDPGMVSDALELTQGHCELLQREDGLFAHFTDLDDDASPQIAWGRGNGWAILGLSRMLDALGPERSTSELRSHYLRLAEALRAHQTTDGSWRNLVDDPHSYPESSTTAMAAAALTPAVAAGVLPEGFASVADRGWASIADRIDANGHLHGVSYRPGVNTDPGRYEHTPVLGSYPWGQGSYLLAAAQRVETPSLAAPQL